MGFLQFYMILPLRLFLDGINIRAFNLNLGVLCHLENDGLFFNVGHNTINAPRVRTRSPLWMELSKASLFLRSLDWGTIMMK